MATWHVPVFGCGLVSVSESTAWLRSMCLSNLGDGGFAAGRTVSGQTHAGPGACGHRRWTGHVHFLSGLELHSMRRQGVKSDMSDLRSL